jgi:hypothetical protein
MVRQKTVLFTITIDTEIDKSPEWVIGPQESYTSVTHGVPDLLSPIFDRYDAKATFLLSGEVMEDDESVEVLKHTSGIEVGTHLHGDLTEPQRTHRQLSGHRTAEMQCSYSQEIEFQKLLTLTDQYRRRFGRSPRSFRAGRWGAGSNTIPCLERLGYAVDSSVSPGVRWDYPEGIADYTDACSYPYVPSRENITRPGSSRILEVPASISCPWVRRKLRSSGVLEKNPLAAKVVDRAFPLSWVTPAFTNTVRIIRAAEGVVREAPGEVAVVNMMFHSVDIIPNASPAALTEADSQMLLHRIEDVLRYASKKGYMFVTLSEVRPYFIDAQN